MTVSIEDINRCDESGFVELLGGVFEHSPWVAKQVCDLRPCMSPAARHAAMSAELRRASRDQHMALLRAHPELAGRKVRVDDLTRESRREQKGAGLDQCSPKELDKLCSVALIDEYLAKKRKEIENWNAALANGGKDPVNTRRVTNIGTFRAYAYNYLKNHPRIDQSKTLIVRQLAPGPEGLPLEIYCFTNTTEWAVYEDIQSDVFDHLLAIVPEFGLRLYQKPAGSDLLNLKGDCSANA